jgi:anti-sigma-K factor RskA
MTCEEFEELSGAYVLGAITPEEYRTAQAHLATCAKCSSLLQGLNAAASVLPLTAPQVEPSPALKERVMEAIRRESQPIPLRPLTRQIPRRRAGWATRLLAVAALLFVLLTGGMTAWNIALQHQITTLQASSAQLNHRVSELQQTNATLSEQVSILHRQIVEVYNIAGTQTAKSASGSLLYLPQQNITVLVLHGLPKLQGKQIYQGWLLHNKAPVSIGVLSMQNGIASLTFPNDISGYDTAAVSLEPGPTPSLHAPAGSVIATATLQHPAQVLFTI